MLLNIKDADTMYKIWLISLVGFIYMQGLFCQVHIKCERDKHTYCHPLAPRIDWGTKFPPNEDEMKELCPTAKGYFECLAGYKQMCPVPSFDPTDETVVATLEIIRELCNETSSLHRDYVKSSECYKSLAASDTGSECERKAEIMFNAYVLHRMEYDSNYDADRTRYRYCMEEAYKMACVSMEMIETCGIHAYNTYLELVHRSKFLQPICYGSTKEELNHEFIEFVYEDEEQQQIFNQAFDL